MKRILVTGAGGFIGSHLVARLKAEGHFVRGADLVLPEFWATAADDFRRVDLRKASSCEQVCEDMDEVYQLAADMGGMGFISNHHAQILHNNLLISTHMIEAARAAGVKKFLFTSSACIYPEYRQTEVEAVPLAEHMAYPAAPQDAYGWEKLVTERLCHHYGLDHGLDVRVVRFHNIFGPYGTWRGGREKAPAAICRKVAEAKLTGKRLVEIWGDGEQTRSFCYIDDCIDGLRRIMDSAWSAPINLGQDRLISINELLDLVAGIAGVAVERKHIEGPMGVRGRNSDNTLMRSVLGWEPTVSLEQGLARTYTWIERQVEAALSSATQEAAAARPGR